MQLHHEVLLVLIDLLGHVDVHGLEVSFNPIITVI